VIDNIMPLSIYSSSDVRKSPDALADQAKCRRDLVLLEHIEQCVRDAVSIGTIIEGEDDFARPNGPSLGLKNCARA
jgi:hypothetical protein